GFTLNIPMMPGAKDDQYKHAFTETFLPAAAAFKPDFVLISAGFDAHREDPLAAISLSDDGYEWLTRSTMEVAAEFSRRRLVSILEGGYNLDSLSRCVAAHVRRLLGG